MKTADQVATIIEQVKQDMAKERISVSVAAWKVAMACVGWAYVFGAYGEYCEPSNRRSRYKADYPKIKENCKNFNGKDSVPAGCVGCKWFLGTAESDQTIHAGRTRFYDCRGFVYWVLHNVCGMWEKCPAGATTMWNTASNWKEKGLVKDGVPQNVLVCLFYPSSENPKKMAHIGFGFNGETVECSKGVEHHTSYDKKWTHWAVPVCVEWDSPADYRPTLRRGDKGEYVTLAQTELLQKGYDLGKCGVDGSFGAATEKAVRLFQNDNKLTVDGIVGQQTWAALESGEGSLYTVTIPHLPKYKAEGLVNTYVGAYMTEEERR